MAKRRDKLEVLNYIGVLKKLPRLTSDNKITEKTVLKIHRMITKGTLENPKYEGVYRDRQVVVVNRLTGKIVFHPPKTEDVLHLMNALLNWLMDEETQNMDPVLQAGIVHYEFVRIHPFVDGNGRTARTLATLILYIRGFDTRRFFALDEYYDSDRMAYYRALQSVDSKSLDLTSWLEYFTTGVAASVLKVKERILRLSSDKLRRDVKGQIALTERQMQIVEIIHERGAITSKEFQQLFRVSRQAVHKEISKLVKLGVIKAIGKARSTKYVLV